MIEPTLENTQKIFDQLDAEHAANDIRNIIAKIEETDEASLKRWFTVFRQTAENHYIEGRRSHAGIFDLFAILVATRRRELEADGS